jgi:hypothetical protein
MGLRQARRMTAVRPASAAAELSRVGDWPGLWRLALDLPLAEAVAAVALIDRRWRPADEPGRELLSRLAAVRPGKIRAVTAPPAPVRLSLRRRGSPSGCQFAPDGSAVVVKYGSGHGRSVILYALPGGQRERGFRALGEAVPFDGGIVFAAASQPSGTHPWIRYVPGHGSEVLGQVRQKLAGNWPAAAGKGFVIAEPGRLLHGTAEPGSPLRDVTPPGLRLDGDRDVLADVVADPLTSRLAVLVIRRGSVVRDDVLILDPGFSVTGQIAVPFDERWGTIHVLGFGGSDRLITIRGAYHDKQLQSWTVGQPSAVGAETELHGSYDIQLLPYAEVIRTGGTCLDAGTLRPAACPGALAWAQQPGGRLMLSRDGGQALLSRSEGDREREKVHYELLVRDLVQYEISEWAARPMSGLGADDLAAVAILQERARARPARDALTLLRACLEYRSTT